MKPQSEALVDVDTLRELVENAVRKLCSASDITVKIPEVGEQILHPMEDGLICFEHEAGGRAFRCRLEIGVKITFVKG